MLRGHFLSSVQAYHQQLPFRLKGRKEKERIEKDKKELNYLFAIVYRAGNLVGLHFELTRHCFSSSSHSNGIITLHLH